MCQTRKRPAWTTRVGVLLAAVYELRRQPPVLIGHPADGPAFAHPVGVRAPVVLEDGDELGARDCRPPSAASVDLVPVFARMQSRRAGSQRAVFGRRAEHFDDAP